MLGFLHLRAYSIPTVIPKVREMEHLLLPRRRDWHPLGLDSKETDNLGPLSVSALLPCVTFADCFRSEGSAFCLGERN